MSHTTRFVDGSALLIHSGDWSGPTTARVEAVPGDPSVYCETVIPESVVRLIRAAALDEAAERVGESEADNAWWYEMKLKQWADEAAGDTRWPRRMPKIWER